MGIDNSQITSCKDKKQQKQIKNVIKKCSITYYENLIKHRFENLSKKTQKYSYITLKNKQNKKGILFWTPKFLYQTIHMTEFRLSDHQLLIET